MAAKSNRVEVRGSDRVAVAGARAVGSVPNDERFEVTVRVRRKTDIASLGEKYGSHADQLPSKRKYLSREEYALSHGAGATDMRKVEAFAHSHNLIVVEHSAARRSVFLSGTAADFAAAFGTKIEHFEHDGGTYRGRIGPLTVPAELAEIVEGVFGIDDRPVAKPHFQRRRTEAGFQAHAAGGSFTPPELAKLYDFPTSDGAGQCIALIELGGGYRASDIKAYFKNLGLPTPKVKTVRIDGGRNQPTNSDSADGEVMLDIEVAAACAPKAHIAVYFAPNTDKGFLDAITAAIHDTKNKPSVISISWGSPEKNWSGQAMKTFDQAFQTAAALGVTVCCASGDAGSGDENPDQLAEAGAVPDGKAHADFPASSPFALGCGGTKLLASGTAITSETVWDADPRRSASGGGVSDFFPVPIYQSDAGVPVSKNAPHNHRGRGVPDVAGNADPATGYAVRVDGQDFVIGGTSAVAPLWAGLIALLNQNLGHNVGFLNPILYGKAVGTGACRDIVSGNNGAYSARKGWDACTGWGSPNGATLLDLLSS